MGAPEKRRYRVALYTMGCKTNQYDSGKLAEEFEASGFRLVPFDQPADVYVINTCTVTAQADREARNASRRAIACSPDAVVVATGCYVQVDARPMASIPGVQIVGGNDLKPELVARVRALLEKRPSPAPAPEGGEAAMVPRISAVGRTRKVIKIQEGCNYRCAYCVVPRARGAARSRPLSEVLEEVRRRADEGTREVVLTGTCIGAYGNDLSPRVTLAECAEAVAATPGIERLRISSIEPWEVEEDLLALAERCPSFCRHFHLPLQSGDDAVRRRMRRPGTTARFAELVAHIRERLPDSGITTDVIAGYPGETDAEFAATYEFCRQMQFSRMHVFRYSPRPFTEAALQPGQVPPAAKEARSGALIRLGAMMADAFAQRWVGHTVRVLVEGTHGPDGLLEGLTGNYIRVHFPGSPDLRGQLVEVQAERVQDGALVGKVVRRG